MKGKELLEQSKKAVKADSRRRANREMQREVLKILNLVSANLEEQRKNTENRWIPVTERLPEEDTRVLVYLNIEKTDANIYTFFDTDRILNGKWVRWNTYISHWMPLPEPPKEG